mmetsp:Transcript_31249/g.66066  ORF Transcript_31249/g.66066 Transcript_31249/m.66066 type:complete len:87 (-) Transcript_31249:125-385(-)
MKGAYEDQRDYLEDTKRPSSMDPNEYVERIYLPSMNDLPISNEEQLSFQQNSSIEKLSQRILEEHSNPSIYFKEAMIWMTKTIYST